MISLHTKYYLDRNILKLVQFFPILDFLYTFLNYLTNVDHDIDE